LKLDELKLKMEHGERKTLSMEIGKVMEDPYPEFSINTKKEDAIYVLNRIDAMMVLDNI